MNLRSLAQSLIRLILGGLFIFSGVIKMNDPLGFSYKLEEYFGADVFNLEFLQPLALPMAVFLVTLEVVLGLLMLIGYLRAFTFWSMAGLMVFFTFLTFYSAYFNKVTDCGCFGDAIPLTPWESFTKAVILSVLIALYFVLGAMQFLYSFNSDTPRAGPFDFRAHLDEEIREIHDLERRAALDEDAIATQVPHEVVGRVHR